MKNNFLLLTVFSIALCGTSIFAQNYDDVPYLSEEDIAAIEMVLPDDIPQEFKESPKAAAEEKTTKENEISRLNSSLPVYHLLVLDRTYSALNSDISDTGNITVLYKYKHGRNGYLITILRSQAAGPVFPQLPARSRIIVNMITVRKNTIKDYISSSAFRRFVTNRKIIADMQKVL